MAVDPLQLGLKFREGYSVPVREEFDQLVASLSMQVPASINSAVRAAATTSVWTPIPFNAPDFTGNGAMTWTVALGGVGTWQYRVSNHTCWVMFDITGTVGGTPNVLLQIKTPVLAVVGTVQAVLTVQTVSQFGIGGVGSPTLITLFKDATQGTNWAAGPARVIGTIMYTIA